MSETAEAEVKHILVVPVAAVRLALKDVEHLELKLKLAADSRGHSDTK